LVAFSTGAEHGVTSLAADGRIRGRAWPVVGRKAALCVGTLLPAGLALAATATQSPSRAIVGLYFLAVFVPALQLVAAMSLGWWTALAIGLGTSALTLWQVATPPRPMVAQPIQWQAGFTMADQRYRVTLRPPAKSRAADELAHGGRLRLQLCLQRGNGDEWDVRIEGRTVPVTSRPSPANCWLEFGVPPDVVDVAHPEPVTVTIAPREPTLPAPTARTILIGGYTRPAAQGGQVGGVEFFDGSQWSRDDLSPLEDGAQEGRLFVELRVLDANTDFVEAWY
jgi:hypothetical protein